MSLPGPAAETFAALLCAHVLADFVLQSGWMAANKRRPAALAGHGAVVLAALVAATGRLHPALLWLALLHLATDALKARARPGLAAFLLDQAAHLAALAALALWQPGLWGGGLWAGLAPLPGLMALLAGAVVAVRAGGFAVGLLMAPFAATLPPDSAAEGLPGAGRVIGWLERGLIFALILLGQPEGVGLLIAAKSILRFGAVQGDRALSEYVIIGTLASFGWALIAAYGCHALLNALPPLGILPISP